VEQLDLRAFAARAGVAYNTLRGWRSSGRPRGNPIPPPDGVIGRSPWWYGVTVAAWCERRTGKGYRSDRSTLTPGGT
jgi:hypothetical protein